MVTKKDAGRREINKVITAYKAAGTTLQNIYLLDEAWKELPTKTVLPTKDKLLNFVLTSGEKKWAVLDSYGNPDRGGLTYRFGRKLFGKTFWKETIAIDLRTGDVDRATFYLDDGGVSIGLGDFVFDSSIDSPIVPKKWLSRIEELLTAKRPFAITLDAIQLTSYIDRLIGQVELRSSIEILLFFRGATLHLHGGRHRVISDWTDS